MKVIVTEGDVLDAKADVLVATANPWLNMSGGVNGAICECCPEIQVELHSHLKSLGLSSVPATTVVRTSAGSLPFSHIIHAVAIDPFYDSSVELVGETLAAVFELAWSLDARSVSLPTLATGYGPLSVADFGRAFAEFVVGRFEIDVVTLVLRSQADADTISVELDNEKS